MILYHVSVNLNHPGIFTPRVPDMREDGEDTTTARVSAAPTLEDCFTSIPYGNGLLDILCEWQKSQFKIFRIDTEKIGVQDRDVIPPRTLSKSGKVKDAAYTEEHWILREFQVPEEDQFLIRLEEWGLDDSRVDEGVLRVIDARYQVIDEHELVELVY